MYCGEGDQFWYLIEKRYKRKGKVSGNPVGVKRKKDGGIRTESVTGTLVEEGTDDSRHETKKKGY